jgi:hypothetical protein
VNAVISYGSVGIHNRCSSKARDVSGASPMAITSKHVSSPQELRPLAFRVLVSSAVISSNIERITQSVADKVKAGDRNGDGGTRNDGQPRRTV